MGGLHISADELRAHGCRNCFWRLNDQCPHGVVEGEGGVVVPYVAKSDGEIDGICPEFASFIMSFAGPTDSPSNLWEKVSLYVAKLQGLEDFREFRKAQHVLRVALEAERSGKTCMSSGELEALHMRVSGLKLWWARLTDQIVKGYGRIGDRESRAVVEQVGTRLTIQQYNVIMGDAEKVLLEDEDGKDSVVDMGGE